MTKTKTPEAAAPAEAEVAAAEPAFDPAPELAPAAEGVVPAKSATDLLIELQLAEQLRKSTNPLAIADHVVDTGEKTADGLAIVERTTFANGAVLEVYA